MSYIFSSEILKPANKLRIRLNLEQNCLTQSKTENK